MGAVRPLRPASEALTLADVVIVSNGRRFDATTLIPFLSLGGMRAVCRRLNGLRLLLERADTLDGQEVEFVVDWLSDLSERLFMCHDDPNDESRIAASDWRIVRREAAEAEAMQ